MVAFDAVGSSGGTNTATPSTTPWLTWTHTAGTGGGTVIVALAWGSTSFPPTITSITYGGNAMTFLGSIASDNTSSNGGILFYGITGQANGANTVLVKTSANPTDIILGDSIGFTLATAFGIAVTSHSSGASASAAVTVAGTAASSQIFAAHCHGTNGTVTWSAGTSRFDDEASAASGASNLSGATLAGGGTGTLTSAIPSDVWGMIGIEVMAQAPGAPPAPPYPAIPVPPGWFPGSDTVTSQPDGIPFAQAPQPVTEPGAVIIPAAPEAAAVQLPLLPPGWFPGADQVTSRPGGIPFAQEPQPQTPAPAVIFPIPEAAGFADWMPLPPGWFPGASQVTTDPGSIPFYSLPQPQTPPPAPPPVPYLAGKAGTGVNGYFTDTSGKPKFLLLEQAWALPSNAGRWNGGNWRSDIGAYFAARSAQGYTAWFGTAWSDNHVDSTALSGGRTWDGIYPIVVNGTPGKITTGSETITLNDPFWTRIDYLFSTALAYGVTCFLNLGMQYDFTGSPNIFFNLSTTQANTFGQLIATRYPQSQYPNVFWFFGDDGSGGQDTFFTQMMSGLAAAGDTRALVSTEQLPETDSHVEFDTGAVFVPGGFGMSSSVTYNWCYSYDPTYLAIEKGYTEAGTTLLPVIYGDGIWYGDNFVTQNIADYTIRRVTWWALASGTRGLNNTAGPTTGGPVWQWQSTAVANLTADNNGTWITGHIGAVISYFTGLTNWYKLIPDTGNVLVTAGRGTKSTNDAPGFNAAKYGDTDNYVAASRVSDGSLAVIYCGQFYSITIDQSKMAAGYTATWVDPLSLATTAATPGSTFNSTPLGNNSAGNPDWVLVLQGTPSAAPLAPGIPDWLPQPPGWFPGSDKAAAEPGGIPFWVQPQPTDQNAPVAAATFTGTASIAGAGAVSDVVTQAAPATAAGAGSVTALAVQDTGTLTTAAGAGAASDVITQIAIATAAGAGAASAVATQIAPATAAGAGAVSDVVTQDAGTLTTAAGAGAVSDVITQVVIGTAAGAGSVTAAVGTPPPAAQGLSAGLPQPPGWFPGADTVTDLPGGIPFYVIPQPTDQNAAIATAIFTGTATAAGAGAVTAVVTQDAGTLTTAAGAGAVSDVVTQAIIGTAAGAGSVTVLATVIAPATAAGAGSVTDVVTQIVIGTAAGAGSVTATGSSSGAATASAAGAGSVTALSTVIVPGTAAGAGAVTTVVTQQAPGAAAGAGAASAAGYIAGTASAAGAGTVTSKILQAVTGTGAGAGAVAALALQQATAALAGAATVNANGLGVAAVIKGTSTSTSVTEQAGMSAAVTEQAGMSATVTNPASSRPGVS